MDYAVEIENMVVEFAARHTRVRAVNGLSLKVAVGSVFGFLGPNGAGKTTTMHVLLGFVPVSSGTARIFGTDIKESIARMRIGYLPENPDTYRFLTARELLHMTCRLFGIKGKLMRERTEELLEMTGIEFAANRRLATYSRGMLQRACLAQALVNDPDLVILDEPTGGLDPFGRMDVRKIIASLKGRGKTVFFSSHELSEVELVCDRVAILSKGTIVKEGTLTDLVPPGQSLEKFFMETAGK